MFVDAGVITFPRAIGRMIRKEVDDIVYLTDISPHNLMFLVSRDNVVILVQIPVTPHTK
jgi:hypothetical protein